MTDAGTLAGQRVSTCTIHVPPVGPWWADVVLEEAPELPAGVLDLAIGRATLRGTVIDASSGVFADRRLVRLVAGAGAWGSLVPATSYHNDAGVSALQVAQAVAQAAGETLGDFAPEASSIGIDYVREAGPAARALEAAIGAVSWWVGFDGVTKVGSRPTSTPGAFELLDFDPVSRLATIGLDDLTAIEVGSVLPADTRLGAAQTVREMRIEISADQIQVIAWCGAAAGTRSREAAALERIVTAILDRRMLVPREYRVSGLSGDRVDLQAVSSALPDLQAISVRGPAGVSGSLVVGTLVLVQWIDGSRTRPVITHAQGKDGNGWAPTTLVLDATDASASIKLGRNATEPPAWASKLLTELNKLVTTLATGTVTVGAPGSTPVVFGTPYIAPGSAASLGAAKTVCE